jgi:hypothetical protein
VIFVLTRGTHRSSEQLNLTEIWLSFWETGEPVAGPGLPDGLF